MIKKASPFHLSPLSRLSLADSCARRHLSRKLCYISNENERENKDLLNILLGRLGRCNLLEKYMLRYRVFKDILTFVVLMRFNVFDSV